MKVIQHVYGILRGEGAMSVRTIKAFGAVAVALGTLLVTDAAMSQAPVKQPDPGHMYYQPPVKQPDPRHMYYSREGNFQPDGKAVPNAKDGIHDPTDEAVRVLSEPYDDMKNFPRDNAGEIDWVQALEKGYIDPRKSRDGKQQMFPVNFDIIFTNTQSMPYVRFPHKQHTEWLTCANCHPMIFLPQKGGNPITMSAIIQGKYCGVCHGKVAFSPMKNCGRCHSVPQEISVKR